MDIEWINKKREELNRLLGSKFDQNNIKFGTSMDTSITNLERVPQDKKVLLEKIKALEEENKELKHQLVMKTLEYKY
ncbi:hypothetical protein [Acinetobacter ursingii]|uniref:hypothetical protein n=1 Tax=Acinetobacter ursingii TaxID=108980 RepID=UPI0021CD1FBC|nr:hypothetical protein [Acinetobacter ursingii]MCU4413279.1 hypothetical protein [Acinetobacter sp. WU_MDCI_Axc73]MCU4608194.1 hypothetical protein [Acinetobacter ursingii]